MDNDPQLSFNFDDSDGEHRSDDIERIDETNPYIEAAMRSRSHNDVEGLMLETEAKDTGVTGWPSADATNRTFRSGKDYLDEALARAEREGSRQTSRSEKLNAIYADVTQRIKTASQNDQAVLVRMNHYRDNTGNITSMTTDMVEDFSERILSRLSEDDTDNEDPLIHGFDVLIAGIEHDINTPGGLNEQQGRELIARAFEAVEEPRQNDEVTLVAQAIDVVTSFRYRWWQERTQDLGRGKVDIITNS